MDEETVDITAPETIVPPRNASANEKPDIEFPVPCHFPDTLSLNNDEYMKGSKVELPEPIKKQQHVLRISEDQLQNECAVPDNIIADRALELFSEALQSDSDIDCSDLNISVSQDSNNNDTVSEKKSSRERKVRFADEPAVDTECGHHTAHPEAQSGVAQVSYIKLYYNM